MIKFYRINPLTSPAEDVSIFTYPYWERCKNGTIAKMVPNKI